MNGISVRRRIVVERDAIRVKRISQRLTIADMASLVRISLTQYKNIESGKSGTSEETALRIADVLNTDFTSLFEILPGANEGSVRNGYRQES